MTISPSPNATRLHPPWLHLARVGWILLMTAAVALFLNSVVNTARLPLPSCAGGDCPVYTQVTREDVALALEMGVPTYLTLLLGGSILARLSLASVGLIIFWRRSDDWVAMIISGALVAVLLEGGQGIDPALHILQAVVMGIGTALFLPIPFIFPNGRFQPRWLRWPVFLITVPYVLLVVFFLESPFYAAVTAVLTILWVLFSIYAMTIRYFRLATPVERQQIKWVLLGIAVVFVNALYYSIISALYPPGQPSPQRIVAQLINAPLYVGLYGFFAFAMLVAMLRYRLWDIDLLIRRTLQYTLLSALLALVYFGGVVLLERILSPLTGAANSPLATVITTLGIAALFHPLRHRVQEFIDRRFYRRKYNAAVALAQFAVTARDEVALERLASALTDVIRGTMQPETLFLWLKKQ